MSVAVRLKKKPATQKTLFGLLAQTMSANPRFGGKFRAKNFILDIDEVSYNPDDDEPDWHGHNLFPTDEFPYCCGLSVIGEFDEGAITGDTAVDAILLRIQLAQVGDNFITATVVQRDQPHAYNMLLGAGFQVMAVWENANTGNEITMFGWNRATVKELPIQ